MKYIEPPSQPKPTRKEKKVFEESKKEKRDRSVGTTIGFLIIVSLLLASIFGYAMYIVFSGR